MKNVFLCPGQGSQFIGMGKDLDEVYPRVRELYDTANEILGFDLGNLFSRSGRRAEKNPRNSTGSLCPFVRRR